MRAVGLAILMATAFGSAAAAQTRILSLDQCADQYVLALRPDAVLALSPRAVADDSHLREAARGRLRVRPTLEAAVGFRPDIVVRTWGGDPRLLRRLAAQGVTPVQIGDAEDFQAVRRNLRAAGVALDAGPRAERLIADMDRRLARVAASRPEHRTAVYMTAGGFTSGPQTFIDAMMHAAGLRNATRRPGYGPLSVERVAWSPPIAFVLGFFDQARADWRGPGRHPVVRRAAQGRVVADLPASVLTCPAWFAVEAVERMAR